MIAMSSLPFALSAVERLGAQVAEEPHLGASKATDVTDM
jgi:hypothetical protein